MNRKISLITIGVAASTMIALSAFGASGHDDMHGPSEHKHGALSQSMHEQGGDPLVEEMVALDAVFRDVVSAVALNDGRRVHEALEKMHGAMEKTHEGVHHGTVTLKKNADRMKDFVDQDKQFHGKLEDLATTADKNGRNVMLFLNRCAKCRWEFRQSR